MGQQNKKFLELKGEQVAKENPTLSPAEAYAKGFVEARELAKGLLTEVFATDIGTRERARILMGGIGESRQYFPNSEGKLIRKEEN